MYLTKETYIGAKWEHRNVTGKIEVKACGKPFNIQLNRVSKITEEIGYWRKANAIHAWFVENVQDGDDNCNGHYVDKEDLQDLLDIVNAVLEDHSKAGDLLPTQPGFFFGSTEYDEWYYGDLKLTKEILLEALTEQGGDLYYNASW